MSEQAQRHLRSRRRPPAMRPCAHTVVDIPAARSYHLPMPFLVDADLADRPDPERQARSAEFRAGARNVPISPAPDSLTPR